MKLQSIAIIVILAGGCYLPLAWLIDDATGVTGFEMQELLPADERPTRLEDFGIDPDDELSVKLEAYGTPGPSTAITGEPYRFVFVQEDRVVEVELGTLIVFDRRAGEELMQAGSLYNIAWLLTAGDLVGGLVLLAVARLRRRRQAVESSP